MWIVVDAVGELEYAESAGNPQVALYQRARKLATLLVVGIGLTNLVAIAVAPFVVSPVFGKGYDDVPLLLVFLLPGSLAVALNKVATVALYAGRHGDIVRRAVFRTALLAGIATIPVVHVAGVQGAAVLASVCYSFLAVQQWAALKKLTAAADERT